MIDVYVTLIVAHSEEAAAPTCERRLGQSPLGAFVDRGDEGTAEPLVLLLRAGNAGPNPVVDRRAVIRAALAQLPGGTAGHEGADPHRWRRWQA
ncbi:hypothetical protein OF117_11215 [Geodermatophilus sp. YIM 151500]|nr:hypothetical protein [Geodermatophilus sp. YIM 151500]